MLCSEVDAGEKIPRHWKMFSEYYLLIAEDNPADLFLIREALAAHGVNCRIDVVETGDDFLAFAQATCELENLPKPDLILLDWSLPKGSGREMIRAIRETDRCANSVILVLTSSISPYDRAEAERAGADDFICKPSDLGEFLAIGERVAQELQKIPPPNLSKTATSGSSH
jgi:chemotaxis family two-component system response regulator Rcp1